MILIIIIYCKIIIIYLNNHYNKYQISLKYQQKNVNVSCYFIDKIKDPTMKSFPNDHYILHGYHTVFQYL